VKVDRLYAWKRCTNAPIVKALKQQNEDVKREFNMRVTDVSGCQIFLFSFPRSYCMRLKCCLLCSTDRDTIQDARSEYCSVLQEQGDGRYL
jgi:hypothetical protein